MSNEPVTKHDIGSHGSFERQDLSPKGVFYFFMGLAIFMVIIAGIIFGVYHVLNSVDEANKTTLSPMVAPTADTRSVTRSDTQAFPEPRLEVSERTQLGSFILDEDRKLATYNWVDKDKGIVQIPIERAMDLIVQRGLPVRPQGQTAQAKEQQNSAGQKQPQLTQQKEGSSAQ